MTRLTRYLPPLAAALLLAACSQAEQAPAQETEAIDAPQSAETTAVAVDPLAPSGSADESIFPDNLRALGTEPFWALHLNGDRLRYLTPEDQEGVQAEATHEESEDALTVRAEIGSEKLVMKVRIAACSDGMSDREYPFAVTVTLGEKTLQGCARPLES